MKRSTIALITIAAIIVIGTIIVFIVTTRPERESTQQPQTENEQAQSQRKEEQSQTLNKTEQPSDTSPTTQQDTQKTPLSPTSETATYQIEFHAAWSKETHPNNYVESAHFSPFVAYSHANSKGAFIFEVGENPSPGIEEMAETGNTSPLNSEIDNLINIGAAFNKAQGKRIDSPGANSSTLKLSTTYSAITFVSMLAPSPDWFVSQTATLIQDGTWQDRIELQLITYDAGGDSGDTFTATDNDTSPKELITKFPAHLQNLGTIVITRIND